ncbi:MAG TPA: gliding motility-associated C-terminal domain-containing protein, partial [Cyclobacteriaceae bacterium]|nr:gliding motility-associated C-terminal domain-containing protein [Cyclobacteriaceae bacterium]
SSTTASVPVNGIVTVELLSLLSDPDDNLDISTLSLTSNTSEQGAAASINASSELVLDYGSVIFIGVDRVSIEVCDLLSACAQQVLSIEVEGDVIIYNAISPNGDNKNDMMRIANIELFSNNHVTVFNRWGDMVFETDNYNNDDRAFKGLNKNGKELPSGIYYYKIELSGSKTKTGYLSLKRE